MIPINYHHLYYFWTVARAGSIAAATKKLYLTQPTLSGQLKQLETSCKTKLFERGRGGVTLTPEGREVFERCEAIFSEGEELAAMIREGFRAPALLRVGVRPTVSREAVLGALSFVRDLEKACRIAVFSGEADDLANKLARRSLDIVIADRDFAPGAGGEFRGREVSRLPVYFVASRAVKRVVRTFPDDLPRTALLLRPESNPVRQQVDRFLARKRIHVRVGANSDDVDLLRRLAAEGHGVAALSALSVAPDLKSGKLVLLHSSPVGIEERVWFVCGAKPRANATVERAVEALMERFELFGGAPKVKSLLGR